MPQPTFVSLGLSIICVLVFLPPVQYNFINQIGVHSHQTPVYTPTPPPITHATSTLTTVLRTSHHIPSTVRSVFVASQKHGQ